MKKTPIKESNLSNKPPWPGIMEPESLIDTDLFKLEALKSPIKEIIITINVNNKDDNENSLKEFW